VVFLIHGVARQHGSGTRWRCRCCGIGSMAMPPSDRYTRLRITCRTHVRDTISSFYGDSHLCHTLRLKRRDLRSPWCRTGIALHSSVLPLSSTIMRATTTCSIGWIKVAIPGVWRPGRFVGVGVYGRLREHWIWTAHRRVYRASTLMYTVREGAYSRCRGKNLSEQRSSRRFSVRGTKINHRVGSRSVGSHARRLPAIGRYRVCSVTRSAFGRIG
jgi:hypothetical protein